MTLRRLKSNSKLEIAKQTLQSIANLTLQIEELTAQKKNYETVLFNHMQDCNLTDLDIEKATASIARPMGRSSTYIDPKKAKQLVSEEDFFSMIKIGVTDAKKILSKQEFAKIAEVKPGELGDPVLIIKLKS